ncbi:tRNA (adenosine(37)-N6)-dimethylallyltransferase MiaA [Myroides sp. LoEW2-1]|uniref:tRNA (adenosine(37)-N6)-dimethylallyltransferase MiaA n=1 Tax=Myroides sp. LoEW2-1 TaxID=2683192 RepID=UPI001321EC96|nr:tRNA (adenosine(37)-N6)-dimethylallyltransferase MiaA [Myroides sp. LoEW2-1]MVX35033.1 tRNA (adenosine(37)-N6)-dimethylallyltransferase MiaA [Myroides sp. LoEW2-1]
MYSKNNRYLIVVIGPTAIGKTALGIEIAKHYNSNIISCDSRQFYREMNIGTAVPSQEELSIIPHHFIQHIGIDTPYSVGDFERDALAKLEDLFQHNPIQVMVGGSGLFVNAIINGLDDFPDIDPNIREDLNKELEEKGLASLQNKLKELDPVHYEKVAIDNPQRVTRALEVCIGTGKPYSSFLNKKANNRNFTPIIIGLEADRELMYQRINKRVDIMIDNGLLKEAEALYPFRKNNALQTVGYRELFTYFDGDCNLDFAIEEIKKNTRRFAKRQMTWFKRTEGANWFDFTTDPNNIIAEIDKIINQ